MDSLDIELYTVQTYFMTDYRTLNDTETFKHYYNISITCTFCGAQQFNIHKTINTSHTTHFTLTHTLASCAISSDFQTF